MRSHPSRFLRACMFSLVVFLCSTLFSLAAEESSHHHDQEGRVKENSPASPEHIHAAPPPASDQPIGVEERLGERIPLDIHFLDEEGNPVVLADLIQGPTIIAPVYYSCPNVCNFLQGGLAMALPKVALTPGEQYIVLSVSFDETETPALAKGSKKNYMTAMRGEFPEAAWHFLTGDLENIRRLTDALGYNFQRQGEDFLHPVVIAVVAADGTIARYLYGTRFLPMDLSLALLEAAEGRVGATIRRVVGFCFSYDPENRRYVFNLLRVSGAAIFTSAAAFLGFLVLTGRKRKKE
jgi:protein SCO1